jgi:hypothetical protein
MKSFKCLFLFTIVLFFLIKKSGVAPNDKVKILTIDSTSEYYVFNTNSLSKEYSIVIAEKTNLINCIRFKKFILIDSIKESINIKMGSRYTEIGFDGLTIGDVRIKNIGVLTKFITNCGSLSD